MFFYVIRTIEFSKTEICLPPLFFFSTCYFSHWFYFNTGSNSNSMQMSFGYISQSAVVLL